MTKNAVIAILAVCLLVLSGALYYKNQADDVSNVPNGQNESPTPTPTNVSDDGLEDEISDWQTYTSPSYGFSIEYPSDWQVALDMLGGEPRFSIYKEGDAPLSHHVNATQVSIFPNGLGTEGPTGESRQVNTDLTSAAETNVVEYYLADNTTRGYYMRFSNAPQTWEDYGYVWGAVLVQNLQTQEQPTENPDHYPVTRLSGQVNKQDYQTMLRILSTFRFTN